MGHNAVSNRITQNFYQIFEHSLVMFLKFLKNEPYIRNIKNAPPFFQSLQANFELTRKPVAISHPFQSSI